MTAAGGENPPARSGADRHAARRAAWSAAPRAEQVRTWNLSSLWRLPLEDGAAWLKCVPPFFAHEGAVLQRLAGGPVPPLIAAEPGRVLLADIPGEDQYGAPLPVLLALVRLLVGLQVQELGVEDVLLALGLPDWRGLALSVAVDDVVHRYADQLDAPDRQELTRLLGGLDRRWADLAACGLPDTLVHGDVHPGNARGDGDRLVLMDWGDCGVGHPLLDQPAMLAPLDAARRAVIYRRFLDHIEPSEHPYHRDDPVLWLRHAAVTSRC